MLVPFQDGGLFTFGLSSFGQLGHNANSSHSTTYPTKVFELMGSTVIQVACGRSEGGRGSEVVACVTSVMHIKHVSDLELACHMTCTVHVL